MNHILNLNSKHFVLHLLAEDIYAAIAENGGYAICNAGLFNLGGQIVVFDAFLTPQAALDLRQASIELFGQAPQFVINSHYHNDHIWGNQVFTPEAQIFSSAHTRELIATSGTEEFDWNTSNAAQRLEALCTQYQNTSDARQRQDLLLWIGEYRGVVEALPHLKVTLPGITFKDQLEFHGTKYTAQLFNFKGGHTASDAVLYLPQAGILFMGDLLFVDFHPYLAEGDPLQLLKALRELSQRDAVQFVPGHGPVGTIEDLRLLIAYVEQCLETAHELVGAGTGYEEKTKELVIPEMIQHWQMSQFYQTNITSLCKRLSSAEGN